MPDHFFDRRLACQVQLVRHWLALTVGLGWTASIATVLWARVLSRVVSRVFLEGQSLSRVQSLLLALLVIAVARAGLTWASEVTANRVAGQIKADLRERLLARVLALGPTFTYGERTGELTNAAVEGIEALDAYFSQYLPQLALAALAPLTFLVLIFPLDLISGLVLLLTAPIIPVFIILIGNLADALTRKQWQTLSRMSAHFLDVLQGLTTLKLFGRARDQVEAIAQISDHFRQTTMSVLRVAFLSALVQEMVATLSTAIVAVEIGLRLLYGRLSFEQAFFVLILAPEFYLPLRLLGARFHASITGVTAARRIFQILESSSSTTSPPYHPVTLSPCHPSTSSGQALVTVSTSPIRFENVHYAYDDGQRPALNGVSFQIDPGQRVALVGPSGAGKSTVAHLLLRFIEPEQGAIRVDGIPLRDVPVSSWREQVAWMPQNPYLFNVTVAENIRLARPNASQAEIVQAAQQAHAHEFIQALPQGYDTRIGERGARLSGGEAQRIALARAFLKDAPLLIFDEATSNLDPEIEALLIESTERLMQGRTLLIIAHRLSTVRRADRIIVLDAGRVAEVGTHASLLNQRGVYWRLVAAYDIECGV